MPISYSRRVFPQALLAFLFLAFGLNQYAVAGRWRNPVSEFTSWIRKPQALSPARPFREGHVRYDAETSSYAFFEGFGIADSDSAPARGSFSDPSAHKSNFGQLRITTNPAYPDEVQMQAAGFMEGYLTAERIMDYSHNMKAWLGTQTNDSFAIGDWLFAQDRWAREQVRLHTAPPTAAHSAHSSRGDGGSATAKGPHSGTVAAAEEYWRAVGLALAQADGLLAGYSARLAEGGPTPALERLTKWDFLFLNALGDMDDLLGVVFPDDDDGSNVDYDASGAARDPDPERDAAYFLRREPSDRPAEARRGTAAGAGEDRPVPRRGPWDGLTPGQVRSRIAKTGRCSALVKVTPSLDDILMGHVTWWGYSSMLRVYKHYELRLTGGPGGRPPANSRVSFSSYPGQISSADDWYLLGSGLVVTETSLDVYDHTLYAASSPATLLSWQRITVANLLASDGEGWAQLAAQHNSGTYNNQYLVVDLKRFTPGAELRPGLLTVMEIIPGMAITADATADLEWGHWPSYNVPYFPEVYNATGYRRHAEALAAKGADYAAAAAGLSFQLAPRAKIFRRDAAGATDLASFRALLRSNAWSPGGGGADPLAAASPWDALCGRGDLDPEDPDVYGCYDGKVTNYRRALALSADAVSGPTTEGGLPPFRWDAHPRFKRTAHRGMPDVFEGEWEEQRP